MSKTRVTSGRDPRAVRGSERGREGGGLLTSSFTFVRIRGISIGAHWSWLFVFALITWSLAGQLFPQSHPGLSETTYLAMGLASAVLFFASILLHELGHAFRALREGMKVGDITLWLFGGVARFKGMFPSPGAEFRIAAAGPAVSVVLVAVFGALALAATKASLTGPVEAVTSYLARINAVVVAFNLIPALPLDGGRILRSWLWHRQRSFAQATLAAATAGKVFGYLLIGVGVLGLFSPAVTGGIWMALLGWFLLQAAEAEAAFVLVRQAFQDTEVRDLMTPNPDVVSGDITVDAFLEDVVRARGHSTYPVATNRMLEGLVSIRLAAAVPPEDRDRVRVRDVALPADAVPVLEPTTPVIEAMDLVGAPPGRAVVVDQGRIAGILSVSDLAKAVRIEQARGVRREPAVRGAGWGVWAIVAVAFALAAAAFYHPPMAVIAPGPAADVADDIKISGVESKPPNGRYLLVAVEVRRPSALGALWATVHPDEDVVPLASVVPEGVPAEEFTRRQRSLFQQSQMLAAAAGARAAGLDARLAGEGARVVSVLAEAPARGRLRPGDVVVAVDGAPVELASDLQAAISSQPPGTEFELRVERDSSVRTIRVASIRVAGMPDGNAAIGVVVETQALDVDLPFDISFDDVDVGGPSAGLAYALTIADMLDGRDFARGRTIAASGTIELDGDVGPVGGLEQKLEAAEAARADLFFVPEEQVELLGRSGIRVRGVDTMDEAISALIST